MRSLKFLSLRMLKYQTYLKVSDYTTEHVPPKEIANKKPIKSTYRNNPIQGRSY